MSATPTRDRHGLEILSRDECLTLLRSRVLGRLAYLDGSTPMIVPVNYVVDGESVVLRSLLGRKADAAVLRAPVAFEVDDHDPSRGSGWSVVVRGQALLVDDPDRIARASAQLESWAVTDPAWAFWMWIRPSQITGRRIRRS
jgi:uncharacterized protein